MLKFFSKKIKLYLFPLIFVFLILVLLFIAVGSEFKILQKNNLNLASALDKSKKETQALKNQDQYKINESLKKDIKNVNETFGKSIISFEKIQDLKAQKVNTTKLDDSFVKILKELSDLNYASAQASLKALGLEIIKATPVITAGFNEINAPLSNSPPSSGYSRQSVKTDSGTFGVDIISADLNSTRVVVDTASDGTCGNDCPVKSLSEYVARSGAYAGINGSFFCPKEYPSCSGKTNSFDLLVMNKNKVYFNSDNNVYSTNPAVIFGGGWIRFVGRALDWGRDTGVDGVLSNFPLYVSGGNNAFGGSGDPKLTSKGARTFVANKGNTVFIGIVYGASSYDAASVLKTLGMENAMGLDQGGSTALWFNGYKAGPGRSIPNAILFIRK